MSSSPPPSDQYSDVGTRIAKALSLYARHPIAIVLISAANLPFNIAGVVVGGVLGLLVLVLAVLVQEIVQGALILAFYQALVGQTPSAHASFTAATDKLGALIEYFLRSLGAAFLLMITVIGIPWGIRIFVRWIFGAQAIMLGNASATEAISESCRLVTNNWWRTFGNLLLLAFLIGAPGLALRLAIPGVAGGVAGAVFSMFTAPIFVGTFTLYYLRLRKEKADQPPAVIS